VSPFASRTAASGVTSSLLLSTLCLWGGGGRTGWKSFLSPLCRKGQASRKAEQRGRPVQSSSGRAAARYERGRAARRQRAARVETAGGASPAAPQAGWRQGVVHLTTAALGGGVAQTTVLGGGARLLAAPGAAATPAAGPDCWLRPAHGRSHISLESTSGLFRTPGCVLHAAATAGAPWARPMAAAASSAPHLKVHEDPRKDATPRR
jgi:hypothetical protein